MVAEIAPAVEAVEDAVEEVVRRQLFGGLEVAGSSKWQARVQPLPRDRAAVSETSMDLYNSNCYVLLDD